MLRTGVSSQDGSFGAPVVRTARLPRQAFLFFYASFLHHQFPDFFFKVISQHVSLPVAHSDAKTAMGLGIPASENVLYNEADAVEYECARRFFPFISRIGLDG
jgi:hypothetical protein